MHTQFSSCTPILELRFSRGPNQRPGQLSSSHPSFIPAFSEILPIFCPQCFVLSLISVSIPIGPNFNLLQVWLNPIIIELPVFSSLNLYFSQSPSPRSFSSLTKKRSAPSTEHLPMFTLTRFDTPQVEVVVLDLLCPTWYCQPQVTVQHLKCGLSKLMGEYTLDS